MLDFFLQYPLVFLIIFYEFGFCRSCDFNEEKYYPHEIICLNFHNNALVFRLIITMITKKVEFRINIYDLI